LVTLTLLSRASFRLHFFGAIAGWSQASSREHAPIFDALAAGDAHEARKARRSHVTHIGELVEAHLKTGRAEA
jgi:DNA-binding GntR family transcriptional regulator